VAASFQEAVVDTLVTKARWAVEATGVGSVCLGGGVAANSRLRERFLDMADGAGVRAFLPPPSMCTDNAAMVAAAAWWQLQREGPSPLDTGADPNLGLRLVP
jgi:N6-L-threonylcarbamoyladenine synthase